MLKGKQNLEKAETEKYYNHDRLNNKEYVWKSNANNISIKREIQVTDWLWRPFLFYLLRNRQQTGCKACSLCPKKPATRDEPNIRNPAFELAGYRIRPAELGTIFQN
jgi:hypothetical protein